MTPVSRSPWRHLSSPVFWLALFVLVLNDHVLKRAGVLPGALTGKLSDFAGLVVAPILLTAILRAESPLARLASFGAVAAGFSAVKLSAAAAVGFGAALTAIGVPSKVIADPTDLIALAALPVAWIVVRTPRAEDAVRPGRLWMERAGLALGLIGCVATSNQNPPSTWSTPAFAVNGTGAPIDLRIRFFDGTLDCEAIGDNAPRALAVSAFGEGIRFHLEPGETVPLSEGDVLRAADPGGDGFDDNTPIACEIALLQADGMPSALVWWSNLPTLSVPLQINAGDTIAAYPDQIDGAIEITAKDGDITPVARGSVKVGAAVASPEPSSCASMSDAATVQWTELPSGLPLTGEVISVDGQGESCLDIVLAEPPESSGGGEGGAGGAGGAGGGEPSGALHHLTLCIPASAFLFKTGDTITLQGWNLEGGRALDITSADGRFVSLRSGAESTEDTLPGSDVAPVKCEGDRTACGAFVVPLSLSFEGASISPGSEKVIGDRRVIVGRAEQVLAAREACEPGRTEKGNRIDYIVVIDGGVK